MLQKLNFRPPMFSHWIYSAASAGSVALTRHWTFGSYPTQSIQFTQSGPGRNKFNGDVNQWAIRFFCAIIPMSLVFPGKPQRSSTILVFVFHERIHVSCHKHYWWALHYGLDGSFVRREWWVIVEHFVGVRVLCLPTPDTVNTSQDTLLLFQ